jgi:predicted MFS family arabinose efflux permease
MQSSVTTSTEKLVVFCVAFSAFVFQFEAFLVNVSLPDMARELNATLTEISFVIIAYLLAASFSFIPAGRLGTRYGIRRIFLIGCMLASLGTLASGLSANLLLLCLSRFLQGAGTGTMVAMAYAMIPFWVNKNRVGWAYGMLSLGAGIGMLTGMPVGGLLSHYLTWHWIFLGTLPVFLALLWFGYKYLPRGDHTDKDTSNQSTMNWLTLVLSSLLIGSVVLILSLGSELGWRSPLILALLIFGIAIGLLLWWRGRNGHGLINKELLHSPGFLIALLTLFIFQLVNGGVRFLMPFYAELGLGLSVLGSSALLLLYPLSFSPTAVWAGRLTDRIGSEPLVAASLFLSALLCAIFAALVSQQAIWIFAIFILVFGSLTALFSPANNRRIMQAAPGSYQSEASALLPVALNLGSLMGISVFETIFSLYLPTMSVITLQQTTPADPSNYLLFQGFTHAFALASLVLLITAIGGCKTRRQIG